MSDPFGQRLWVEAARERRFFPSPMTLVCVFQVILRRLSAAVRKTHQGETDYGSFAPVASKHLSQRPPRISGSLLGPRTLNQGGGPC